MTSKITLNTSLTLDKATIDAAIGELLTANGFTQNVSRLEYVVGRRPRGSDPSAELPLEVKVHFGGSAPAEAAPVSPEAAAEDEAADEEATEVKDEAPAPSNPFAKPGK